MENKSKELGVATLAALEAGKILEKYFETGIEHSFKDDNSIITAADGESEEIIKKIILDAFPDHSILAEETGYTKNLDTYTWHVDPIDGTRNFSRGIPFFAISIALEKKGDVVLGVIYNPPLKLLYYAELGKGAYLNNKKIHVSSNNEKKCIVTIASDHKPERLKIRRKLLHDLPGNIVSSVRDFGCTALDLAYVASGGTEADIKFGFKIHDFAAGTLLVKEAGGKVTTADGEPWNLYSDSYIASNGLFHDLLVEEVKRQKEELGIK